ncbi:MAG: M20 family metallo-hydrolase [Bacillaceae bacterium]|nr:M20 family metallo-hydrolase [Bacillaceae bacterium]
MEEWLEQTLIKLNLVDTMEQKEGFTRLGYTEEENESIQQFTDIANDLGLTVYTDSAGNVFARWEGFHPTEEVVTLGSHLDTVIQGGGYDGQAGIVCALGAIKTLKEQGFTPKNSIEIIVFRSEESARFGISTIGSKSVSGILDLKIGNVKDSNGTTLMEAVEHLGLKWSDFPKAKRGNIKSFLELHIEQGTIIEENNKQFGVVRGVACPIRLKVKITGKASHTGTTPMHKRQDALLSASQLIPFVYERALHLSSGSEVPVVATASTMEVKPNAMNVIPSYVEVGIDIRSVSDELKQQIALEITKKCEVIEELTKCSIEVETLVHNPSILLDETIQQKLVKIGDNLGYTSLIMDSGAGHDVMNMQNICPSGLIFIPCKEGLSHHPDEYASIQDLHLGVEIIAEYLKLEAGDQVEDTSRGSRTK